MNAPIAATDGSSVLPGTPPAAPQPLADIQGKTPEQIQEELKSGKMNPDDLLKKLDEAEAAGLITSEPERAPVAPSVADVLAAVAAVNPPQLPAQAPAQPAVPPQPPAAAPAAAAPQLPPAPPQRIAAEIDPSWLGHYYFDKNGKPMRTPAEAVQQLSIGKQEVDRHVDYLSKERIPAIERERDAFRQELETERSAKVALEAEIAKLKVQPPAAAAAAPQLPPAPPEPEIKVPEVPPIPELLSGDDVYDTEKVKKYNEGLRAHLDGLKAANDARVQILLREQQKAVDARIAAQEKIINELKESSSLSAQPPSPPPRTSEPTSVSQQDVAAKAAQDAEFKEIDTMVASHKAIFGENARSVRDIENDNIQFMRNLAAANNIPGDIFETVTIENRPVVRIKPQVTDLLSLYNNQHLPDGRRVKEVADARGLKPPADIDLLNRVYEIRRLKRRSNLPYEDALYLMGRTNDRYNESKIEQAKLQANVQASQARQAAVAGQRQFAREPAPGTGAPCHTVEDMPMNEFYRIIRTPKEQRSDEDVEILKRIEEAKGMRPGELTNV